MLADPRGELRVAAASTEQAGLLELFQLQNDQGPCLECFRTGLPVTAAGLAGPAPRWPRFAGAAAQAGFAAVEALPMRLRDQVIGALNLFRAEPGPFDVSTAPPRNSSCRRGANPAPSGGANGKRRDARIASVSPRP